LSKRRLYLTLGAKYEHNDFSGAHFLPNARVSFLPSPNQTIWAASSWAVRTPSRAESDMRVILNGFEPANFKVLLALFGNPAMQAEELWSNEIGYRIRPSEDVSLDLTGFYNDYDWLRSNNLSDEDLPVLPDTTFIAGLKVDNLLTGQTYGFEVAANIRLNNSISFKSGYSFLKIDVIGTGDPPDLIQEQTIIGQSPINQLFLRSAFELHRDVHMDLNLRYVDELPSLGVEHYVEADIRLGWHLNSNLQLVLLGQNLLHDRHTELNQNIDPTNNILFPVSASSDVQRSFLAKLNVNF
jgi:iron complex outermembrane receptor protein